MAPPATPAATKPTTLLKKIPPWGWAIGVGGILGIGYTLYKGRRTPTVLDAPAGETELTGDYMTDYSLAAQPSPGGAYYPSTPIIAEPAETVGAVGQTALETTVGAITGIVESIPALIASVPTPIAPDPIVVEQPEPVVVQIPAPPPPQPKPAAPKAPTQTQGVTILGRNFPRAVSYREKPNPGVGRTFVITFRDGHTETWRTHDMENGKRIPRVWNRVS